MSLGNALGNAGRWSLTNLFVLSAALGCGAADPSVSEEGPEVGSVAQALSGGGQGFALVTISNGSVPVGQRYNSSGGDVTVKLIRTGQYQIDFVGMLAASGGGGNFQVVAYGTSNVRCSFAGGNAEQNYVYCHTPAGVATNSSFVVQYYSATNSGQGPGAYLYEDNPSSTAMYTPQGFFNWNSTGTPNRIQRQSVGVYYAYMSGLAAWSGSAEVTAHSFNGEHCKLEGWGPVGADQQVNVRCFNTAGAPVDIPFELNYLGPNTHATHGYGAYALAHDGSYALGDYVPNPFWSSNSCASGTNTAGRYSLGRYYMRHSSFPSSTKAGVHVTAHGLDAGYCKVEQWLPQGTGVEVQTRCFDGLGNVADSRYTDTYSTSATTPPC